MEKNKILVVHDQDADGFCAAYLISKCFGVTAPDAEVVFFGTRKYKMDKEPKSIPVDCKLVAFVDLTPDHHVVSWLTDNKCKIIDVVDHHPVSKEDLDALHEHGVEIESPRNTWPSATGILVFRLNKLCGLSLASTESRMFLAVDAMDTRSFTLASRKTAEPLFAGLYNFGAFKSVESVADLVGMPAHVLDAITTVGSYVVKQDDKKFDALKATVTKITDPETGVTVHCFNGVPVHLLSGRYIEELGPNDVVATILAGDEPGTIYCRLRSSPNHGSCIHIAKKFGGGGHYAAASFYAKDFKGFF